jgi:hypothetical protein
MKVATRFGEITGRMQTNSTSQLAIVDGVLLDEIP